VLDYFTPFDQLTLDIGNHDLGSGGLLLLPDQGGVRPHLMTCAGKNSKIYLVDRDNLGHFNLSNDNQIVQSLPLPNFLYSTPIYFNGRVYFAPIGSTVRAYDLAAGELSTTPSSQSAQTFAFPGAALTISANGASSGILWAVERNGDLAPGVLRAYNPANLGVEYYNSDLAGAEDTLGPPAKFSIPLVANGSVYVGTLNELVVYGLLP
jgi:hypothetical protein